jgi:hypothetical protein
MAEMGTVGQCRKLDASACTVRPQAPSVKSRLRQFTEAAALPGTAGAESGLAALNVTVAGLTSILKLPRPGCTDEARTFAGARGRRGTTGRHTTGSPTTASNTVLDTQAPIGSQVALMEKVAVAV